MTGKGSVLRHLTRAPDSAPPAARLGWSLMHHGDDEMKRLTLLSLVAAFALSGCVVVPAHDYYGRDYRRIDRDGSRYEQRDRYRSYDYYDRRGDWQRYRGGDQSGGTYAP